jgi:hypothetical protein
MGEAPTPFESALRSRWNGRPAARPPVAAAWILFGVFALSIVASWAWFNVNPPRTERLRLSPRPEIPGWTFVDLPLSEGVQKVLATTNLINGSFGSERGARVMVFAADWKAEDSRSMSVVQHTPDICWVEVGWRAEDLGQPKQVDVMIGQESIPFQCRVFKTPDGSRRELVLWCTLVGGTILQEGERWQAGAAAAGPGMGRTEIASRRLALNQWVGNVIERRKATGDKQFLRLSIQTSKSWEENLERLREFAARWLELERTELNAG